VAGGQVFDRYHIILVWGVFGVVTWATILLGFPFTLQSARQKTPREVWNDPLFHRVNLRLTAVWGAIFTLDAALAIVALDGSYVRMLSVIIPGASMIFGYIFNRIYLARYRSRFVQLAGQSPAADLRG
jgi:all-trans-retinol 13,14-reductase